MFSHLTGALFPHPLPKAISAPGNGGKFTPDGQVLPFPGNTLVCHLDRRSDQYAALTELQNELRALPTAHHYAFLPPESFHMTIFSGISGDPLGQDGWPEGVPRDATIETLNTLWAPVMMQISGFEQVEVEPITLFGGNSLHVQPTTPAFETTLRQLRDTLRDITGITRPDHDSYVFHISLAYLTTWLSDQEAVELIHASEKILSRYADRLAQIPFGPVEYCTFETMFHFEPMFTLP